MVRKHQPLIAQAGGLLALICFFLPWVSCLDEKHSGIEIGGYAWVSFVSSGAILLSVHFFKSAGRLSKARSIVRVAAVAALLALAIVYLQAKDKWGSLLKPEYGGLGTIVGFVMALYGSFFLEEEG